MRCLKSGEHANLIVLYLYWCPSVRCVCHEDLCEIEHCDLDISSNGGKTSPQQLVHWFSANSKLLISENMTTGEVHGLEKEALQERFDVRFVTTQPKHAGFSTCSRLRGWHIAAIQLQYIL